MKILNVFFLILLFSFSTNAQTIDKHLLYVNFGFGAGNYYEGHVGVTYIYKNNILVEATLASLTKTPKNRPSDYQSYKKVPGSLVYNTITSYELLLGKANILNNKETFRATLCAGANFSIIEEPYDWEVRNTWLWGTRYGNKVKRENTLGFVVECRFEYLPYTVLGFYIAPYLKINKKKKVFGVKLNIMIGKVRGNIKT